MIPCFFGRDNGRWLSGWQSGEFGPVTAGLVMIGVSYCLVRRCASPRVAATTFLSSCVVFSVCRLFIVCSMPLDKLRTVWDIDAITTAALGFSLGNFIGALMVVSQPVPPRCIIAVTAWLSMSRVAELAVIHLRLPLEFSIIASIQVALLPEFLSCAGGTLASTWFLDPRSFGSAAAGADPQACYGAAKHGFACGAARFRLAFHADRHDCAHSLCAFRHRGERMGGTQLPYTHHRCGLAWLAWDLASQAASTDAIASCELQAESPFPRCTREACEQGASYTPDVVKS